MRQAIVTVRDEDGEALGLGDVVTVFREAGLVDIEVLSCEGSRGVVRVEVEEGIDEEELCESSSVVWYERVSGSESGPADRPAYVVEFDAAESSNMTDACADDLLLCGVTDVNDGTFTFDVAGPQDAIRDTVGEYERTGASVSLEALREYEGGSRPLDALTARQRDVLETAYGMGYFDVPRSATTGDVAAELDLDDSTVAEHLQRAERNLVSSVIAGG